MRSYKTDSPHAAGRILALAMVVDGNVAASELTALNDSRVLEQIALAQVEFRQLMQELCDDLASTARHGMVQLDHELIDSLLDDIQDPALRRRLFRAMWTIADADGWLADAEAVLLARANVRWGAERSFVN